MILFCVEVDMREARPRAFSPGSALARLMPILFDVRPIRPQYRHMCAVGNGANPHVIVDWRGQMFVRQDINFRSWRAMHPVYERAGYDVAVSSEISVLVLGARDMIRNSPAHCG